MKPRVGWLMTVYFWSSRAFIGTQNLFKVWFADGGTPGRSSLHLGLEIYFNKIQRMACFYTASELTVFHNFEGLWRREKEKQQIICSAPSLKYLLSAPLQEKKKVRWLLLKAWTEFQLQHILVVSAWESPSTSRSLSFLINQMDRVIGSVSWLFKDLMHSMLCTLPAT